MFERIKVDNIEHSGIPAELTLSDGEVVKGRLLIPTGRNPVDAFNAPGSFLEFERYGAERTYFSKAHVHAIKLINVPKAPNLGTRVRDLDGFDPHAILGVPAGSAFDDIKSAWHRLAKVYHPDRYSSAELPPEVAEYLAIMARRINAAFAALENANQSAKRAAVGRSTPVYSSGTRA